MEGGNWSRLVVYRKGSLMEQVTLRPMRLPSLVGIPVSLASPSISAASRAFDCLQKLPGHREGKGDGLRLQVHFLVSKGTP